MDDQNDNLILGGNIELTGFKEIDRAKMIVVKKIVGSYSRKFSSRSPTFEKLHLTLKKIGNSKYEIHGKLADNGKVQTSEVTEPNLFVALDKALQKLEHQK